jgi:UDP-N-acetylmuramoyl-L-alanyl-D-glutamate--2,6-diaminopimelate ligase
MSVGRAGKALRLISAENDGFGQRLAVEHESGTETFRLPLVGAFQASNALVAAGLCMATGASAAKLLPLLENLHGARGRLDLAGTTRTGAPIFIGYAHTRMRSRASTPFGLTQPTVGGVRLRRPRRGKRPQMGAAAVESADIAIVTDDNPRDESEDIRREILAAAPGAIESWSRGRRGWPSPESGISC